jgi:hypothetical protein
MQRQARHDSMPPEPLEGLLAHFVAKYPSLERLAQARSESAVRSERERMIEVVYSMEPFQNRPSSVAVEAVAAARSDLLRIAAGNPCQHWD